MPPEWAAKPGSSSDCMSRVTSVNWALMRISMPSRCFFSSSSIVNPPFSYPTGRPALLGDLPPARLRQFTEALLDLRLPAFAPDLGEVLAHRRFLRHLLYSKPVTAAMQGD